MDILLIADYNTDLYSVFYHIFKYDNVNICYEDKTPGHCETVFSLLLLIMLRLNLYDNYNGEVRCYCLFAFSFKKRNKFYLSISFLITLN